MPPDDTGEPHPAPPADTGAADAPLVLVVEDEPEVRYFSVEILKDLGYRILEASGPTAALRLLDANPDVELLFTDVVMPELNGRKLADEARRRRPGLKVLFTTGYTRDAVRYNGVLSPGIELIPKPFDFDALAVKVREVLAAPAVPLTAPATADAGRPR